MARREAHPTTPDGRYFVARGRLWRRTDPSLSEEERRRAVKDLMRARRAVRDAAESPEAERAARDAVDRAKRALGERGPVWWEDGAPDLTGRAPRTTPYADWWAALGRDGAA